MFVVFVVIVVVLDEYDFFIGDMGLVSFDEIKYVIGLGICFFVVVSGIYIIINKKVEVK